MGSLQLQLGLEAGICYYGAVQLWGKGNTRRKAEGPETRSGWGRQDTAPRVLISNVLSPQRKRKLAASSTEARRAAPRVHGPGREGCVGRHKVTP